MLEFKQQVDPLADAKAWLAHMEKTIEKLAAEHVHQDKNDRQPECETPFSEFQDDRRLERSASCQRFHKPSRT
jgi:hypothetical protein